MSGRQMSILIGLVVMVAVVSNALYVVNERERAVYLSLVRWSQLISSQDSILKCQLLTTCVVLNRV